MYLPNVVASELGWYVVRILFDPNFIALASIENTWILVLPKRKSVFEESVKKIDKFQNHQP